MSNFANVGAAPHLPAGILSPYRDGEKGLVAGVAASLSLPVTIRGEMSGRTVRGSTALRHEMRGRTP
ncbi:MAG: hypothetical protein E5W90_20900 [Mesorhizobium sp.]|nr:MAG: hypothetical protein E5W65_10770 [Mesorhizobium sp.]TIT61047.1 MAG: hypothetical protein E5W63_12585 [Mesorhizobium sp.]TIT64401.1 MAG: hypothetical protein E5W90_20900 [Mesorhizobium sp.]